MRALPLALAAFLFLAPADAQQSRTNTILEGLRWLARHQGADGGWQAVGYVHACPPDARCEGAGSADYDVGVTGLALLAFLGAGYTDRPQETHADPVTGRESDFGTVVASGLRHLLEHQAPDGCLSPRVSKLMYNHAIATLALCEAYGVSGNRTLADPAQRAVDWLVAARNPTGAWRYSPRSGDSDASVTAWCVMALKSAELSGLNVDRSAMTGALAFYQQLTEPEYGRCGYLRREDAGSKVVVVGKNEDYVNHETTTAMGMLVRVFVDRTLHDPALLAGANLLVSDLPVWKADAKTNDYYYWYFGTLAMFQVMGPGSPSPHWKAWSKARHEALRDHQIAGDRCGAGSWPANDRWGFEGGRVYATALSVLMLEEYYAYETPERKK